MPEIEPQLHSPEHQKGVENSAEQKEKLQHLTERAQHSRHELKENEQAIHNAAKHEAVSASELKGKIGEKEKPKAQVGNFAITKATKKTAYKKTLRHIQRQLPKSEKSFSKVIHQPVIEKVSEVGAKTIARPSGVLAGGVCALVGSSVVLYMAKHYGFQYNYFLFILLMILGFAVGLCLELIWSGTKKLRRH